MKYMWFSFPFLISGINFTGQKKQKNLPPKMTCVKKGNSILEEKHVFQLSMLGSLLKCNKFKHDFKKTGLKYSP